MPRQNERYESYWMATTRRGDHPPLREPLDVDVAVVGGGIAGLCTAWELSRAGQRVAVLEALRVAESVTGHTTGKLTSLHGLRYARLIREAGRETARLYARSQQDAVEHVAATADELGVHCDLERAAAYVYAESPETRDEVRAEADAAHEAGLDAVYTEETDLPFPVLGAVRLRDQVQFHPRKYLLALVADILAHGGQVFEGSRVVALSEGAPCRVTTESGVQVTARDVVVATHYPVFDRALLFARLRPVRELVVAGPVPANEAPDGMYVTPEMRTRSVRSAPSSEDGQRLLILTGEKFTPGASGVVRRQDRLAQWARDRFPSFRPTYRWAAQDTSTTDGIPYIGHFHPGTRHVYVATGFDGWGMSGGVMAGRLLAGMITGGKLPWTDVYDPRRLHPLREAPSLVKAQAEVARHFVGDRIGVPKLDAAAQVAPGTGQVLRVHGRRAAVYHDAETGLRAVSASCTHLGCTVHFNDAERTWDCPCHGSRFGVDGAVLNGPATRPLEPIAVDDETAVRGGEEAGEA
ncbi:FAD-dependent oxidoreductase [Yinghuangia sp. YIM S09857]|uniref:FAD-dependent oxidoreductase n=1 Tax=Yinghuangia sp. YIM S09857 TaxID=3436929 RepID=UPI003F53C6AF